ncbi:hypothetical protein PR048_009510 [Dryococelus australis]|uniref:Uncharacterized protein n=1 Tax=Dryococelus australis TaxID=614101 RepID=A0ABQ9I159_9NEOP|nr:hypothetical protein PR048_009510 [Dryococelus australis]
MYSSHPRRQREHRIQLSSASGSDCLWAWVSSTPSTERSRLPPPPRAQQPQDQPAPAACQPPLDWTWRVAYRNQPTVSYSAVEPADLICSIDTEMITQLNEIVGAAQSQSGHLLLPPASPCGTTGIEETHCKINQIYTWDDVSWDMEAYVRQWQVCGHQDHHRHHGKRTFPTRKGTQRKGQNQKIKKGLRIRMYGDHPKWDTYLPDIPFTLHHRHNEALGASPSELLLGCPLQCSKVWDWEEELSKIPQAEEILP